MRPFALLSAAALLTTCPALGWEPAAKPFPLSAVRLTDSPFSQNMDRCSAYLLSLEPDRLLFGFRNEAGLAPKGECYGGWEAQGVAGHSLGHYLSGVSMAFAATGDARFKERADYIVEELARCQQAQGDGFVSAIPKGREAFEKIRAGEVKAEPFNLNGIWVPWYTQHKLLAGLLDAHAHTGNAQALEIAVAFARYAQGVTENLTDEAWQTMLSCEHGGMNESLAELYARTGDDSFLALSRKFHHRAVLEPLGKGKDILPGLHGNTQIPKMVGVARRYELAQDPDDRIIAEFFWDRVTRHHSYVTGGHSLDEHFGDPDHLAGRLGPRNTETCNTYNMLKLTQHLFSWDCSPEKADFYERALYNHILASQDPRDGMVCYYIPLQAGLHKTYSTPFDSFWCCTGTGMENHVRYGEAIYFHSDDALYVNLFIPSELTWAERGVTLRQETSFPESEETRFTFSGFDSETFTLYLRVPSWAAGLPEAAVNGEPASASTHPDGYLALHRTWKEGDTVSLRLPMGLRLEAMPDDARRQAVLYGPLVLAADLGPVTGEESGIPGPNLEANGNYEIPILRVQDQPLESWFKPVAGQPLTFLAHGPGLPEDLTFIPFYRMHHRRYTVYLDLLSEEDWRLREEERLEKAREQAALEARTVDSVAIGENDSEEAHAFRAENSRTGAHQGLNWRDAADGGWFEYTFNPGDAKDVQLMITYWGSDAGARNFDILVNGQIIASESLDMEQPGAFFTRTYPLPQSAQQPGQPILLRFQAHPGNMAGGVFGIRLVREP